MTSKAESVLQDLLAGNQRFRSGQSLHRTYSPEDIQELAGRQAPKAGIVACADSRVSPEVVFDQPLGSIFASRVPGNVASDSAKWMIEIAVCEFQVPLVLIVGHTGCLAVGQLLDGNSGGAGGHHRYSILNAVYKAKAKRPEDIYRTSIEENVHQTIEQLFQDLQFLRSAVLDGITEVAGAVYDMHSGQVILLENRMELYGRF